MKQREMFCSNRYLHLRSVEFYCTVCFSFLAVAFCFSPLFFYYSMSNKRKDKKQILNYLADEARQHFSGY